MASNARTGCACKQTQKAAKLYMCANATLHCCCKALTKILIICCTEDRNCCGEISNSKVDVF